jgi:hypothetical protein
MARAEDFSPEELATLDKALDIAARHMVDGLRLERSHEGRDMLMQEISKLDKLRKKVRTP